MQRSAPWKPPPRRAQLSSCALTVSLHCARSELEYNGKTVQMWTYKQLEQQAAKTIKARATLTRDIIGAGNLPPLSIAGGVDQMIHWLLTAQCMLAESQGLQLTPADFGAPNDLVGHSHGAEPSGYQMATPYGTAADQHSAPVGYKGQAPPRAPMTNQTNSAAAMQAHYDATSQAQAARLRNQQGSNIFG